MTRTGLAWTLWPGLVAVGMVSWWVFFEQSSSASYVDMLLALAALHVLVGTALVARFGATCRRAGLVTAIVLAGQGWLLLWSGVILLWRINGFAP